MLSNRYENPQIKRSTRPAVNPVEGVVVFDWGTFFWRVPMCVMVTVGSALTLSTSAVVLFFVSSVVTLCLGHSLGMHRRFIYRSYECPRWLELFSLHLGTLVGLAGPLGMLSAHDLQTGLNANPGVTPICRTTAIGLRMPIGNFCVD